MNSQAVLCLPHSAPPPSPLLPGPEAYAYTDRASTGSRGPGGYGVVIRWEGKTKEISGSELNTRESASSQTPDSEVAMASVLDLLQLVFRLAVSLELLRFFAQDLDGLLDGVQVGAQAQDGYT